MRKVLSDLRRLTPDSFYFQDLHEPLFTITLQLYNLTTNYAGELFKPSKDAASLLDSVEKNRRSSAVFFKENVRYPVWTCRDPISLILGTR